MGICYSSMRKLIHHLILKYGTCLVGASYSPSKCGYGLRQRKKVLHYLWEYKTLGRSFECTRGNTGRDYGPFGILIQQLFITNMLDIKDYPWY